MHHAGIQFGQQPSAMSTNPLTHLHYNPNGTSSLQGGSNAVPAHNLSTSVSSSGSHGLINHSAIASISSHSGASTIPTSNPNNGHHSTTGHSDISTGSTASLRQWRKKDDKFHVESTNGAGEAQAIARVAPHTHNPLPRTNETYQNQRFHQYQDYSTGLQSYKELSPVKYSEIVEPHQQQHLPKPIHKEKDYMDICSVVQQPPQQPPPHMVSHQPQMKQYPANMLPYAKEYSIHPKESHMNHLNQYPQYTHLHKDFYPNHKLTQYQRPLPSSSIPNQYQNEYLGFAQSQSADIQSMYPYPNRTHASNRNYRTYHTSSVTQPPPNPQYFQPTKNQDLYRSNLYAGYKLPHQVGVGSFDLRNISPRRVYHETLPHYAPRVSPNYNTSQQQLEYAQHYQNRRDYPVQQLNQDLLKVNYPQHIPDLQTMTLSHSLDQDPSSQAKSKSSLKQFIEMWNEETVEEKRDTSQGQTLSTVPNTMQTQVLPDIQTPVPIPAPGQESLYILDSTEISSDNIAKYLHLQVDKLPENIKGFLGSPKSVITSPLNLTQDSVIREPGISVISENKRFTEEEKTSENIASSVIVFGEHNKAESEEAVDENKNNLSSQESIPNVLADNSVIKTAVLQKTFESMSELEQKEKTSLTNVDQGEKSLIEDQASQSSSGVSKQLNKSPIQEIFKKLDSLPSTPVLEEIPKPLNEIEQFLDDVTGNDNVIFVNDQKCQNSDLMCQNIETSPQKATSSDIKEIVNSEVRVVLAKTEEEGHNDSLPILSESWEENTKPKVSDKEKSEKSIQKMDATNTNSDKLETKSVKVQTDDSDVFEVQKNSVILKVLSEMFDIQIVQNEETKKSEVTIKALSDCNIRIINFHNPEDPKILKNENRVEVNNSNLPNRTEELTSNLEEVIIPEDAVSSSELCIPEMPIIASSPKSETEAKKFTEEIISDKSSDDSSEIHNQLTETPKETAQEDMPLLQNQSDDTSEAIMITEENPEMPQLDAEEMYSPHSLDAMLSCSEIIIEQEDIVFSLNSPMVSIPLEELPMEEYVSGKEKYSEKEILYKEYEIESDDSDVENCVQETIPITTKTQNSEDLNNIGGIEHINVLDQKNERDTSNSEDHKIDEAPILKVAIVQLKESDREEVRRHLKKKRQKYLHNLKRKSLQKMKINVVKSEQRKKRRRICSMEEFVKHSHNQKPIEDENHRQITVEENLQQKDTEVNLLQNRRRSSSDVHSDIVEEMLVTKPFRKRTNSESSCKDNDDRKKLKIADRKYLRKSESDKPKVKSKEKEIDKKSNDVKTMKETKTVNTKEFDEIHRIDKKIRTEKSKEKEKSGVFIDESTSSSTCTSVSNSSVTLQRRHSEEKTKIRPEKHSERRRSSDKVDKIDRLDRSGSRDSLKSSRRESRDTKLEKSEKHPKPIKQICEELKQKDDKKKFDKSEKLIQDLNPNSDGRFISEKHNFSILSKDEKTKTKIKTPSARNKKLESLVESSIVSKKSEKDIDKQLSEIEVNQSEENNLNTSMVLGGQNKTILVKTKAQLKETPEVDQSLIKPEDNPVKVDVGHINSDKISNQTIPLEKSKESEMATVFEINSEIPEVEPNKPDIVKQTYTETFTPSEEKPKSLEESNSPVKSKAKAQKTSAVSKSQKQNRITSEPNRKRLSLEEYKKKRSDKLPSQDDDRKSEETNNKPINISSGINDDFETLLERALDAPNHSKLNIPAIIETFPMDAIRPKVEEVQEVPTIKPIVIALESDKNLRPTDPRRQNHSRNVQNSSAATSGMDSEVVHECVVDHSVQNIDKCRRKSYCGIPTDPRLRPDLKKTPSLDQPQVIVQKPIVTTESEVREDPRLTKESEKKLLSKPLSPSPVPLPASTTIIPQEPDKRKENIIEPKIPKKLVNSPSSSESSDNSSDSDSDTDSSSDDSSTGSESSKASSRSHSPHGKHTIPKKLMDDPPPLQMDLNKEIDDIFNLTQKKLIEFRPRKTENNNDIVSSPEQKPNNQRKRFLINLDEIQTNLTLENNEKETLKKKKLFIDPDDFNLDDDYAKTIDSNQTDSNVDQNSKQEMLSSSVIRMKNKNIIDLNELLPSSGSASVIRYSKKMEFQQENDEMDVDQTSESIQDNMNDVDQDMQTFDRRNKDLFNFEINERNIENFINKEPPSLIDPEDLTNDQAMPNILHFDGDALSASVESKEIKVIEEGSALKMKPEEQGIETRTIKLLQDDGKSSGYPEDNSTRSSLCDDQENDNVGEILRLVDQEILCEDDDKLNSIDEEKLLISSSEEEENDCRQDNEDPQVEEKMDEEIQSYRQKPEKDQDTIAEMDIDNQVKESVVDGLVQCEDLLEKDADITSEDVQVNSQVLEIISVGAEITSEDSKIISKEVVDSEKTKIEFEETDVRFEKPLQQNPEESCEKGNNNDSPSENDEKTKISEENLVIPEQICGEEIQHSEKLKENKHSETQEPQNFEEVSEKCCLTKEDDIGIETSVIQKTPSIIKMNIPELTTNSDEIPEEDTTPETLQEKSTKIITETVEKESTTTPEDINNISNSEKNTNSDLNLNSELKEHSEIKSEDNETSENIYKSPKEPEISLEIQENIGQDNDTIVKSCNKNLLEISILDKENDSTELSTEKPLNNINVSEENLEDIFPEGSSVLEEVKVAFDTPMNLSMHTTRTSKTVLSENAEIITEPVCKNSTDKCNHEVCDTFYPDNSTNNQQTELEPSDNIITSKVSEVNSEDEINVEDDDDISCTIEETKVTIRNLRKREQLKQGTKSQKQATVKQNLENATTNNQIPPKKKSTIEDISQRLMDDILKPAVIPPETTAATLGNLNNFYTNFPPLPPMSGNSWDFDCYKWQYYQQFTYQQMLFYQQHSQYLQQQQQQQQQILQQQQQQQHHQQTSTSEMNSEENAKTEGQYASILSNEDLKMKLHRIPSISETSNGQEGHQTCEDDDRRRKKRKRLQKQSSGGVEEEDYLVIKGAQKKGIPKLIIKRSISNTVGGSAGSPEEVVRDQDKYNELVPVVRIERDPELEFMASCGRRRRKT